MNCGLGHKRGKQAVATIVYRVPGPNDPPAYARLALCGAHALAALRLGHTLTPLELSRRPST